MNKFEEFTRRTGQILLINTDRIVSVTEDTHDGSLIETETDMYYIKESYIEVFERLQ
jgi:hypothetical protein